MSAFCSHNSSGSGHTILRHVPTECGKAEDLAVCFKDGIGAIVNSSRGIIAAHTKEQYKGCFTDETEFAKAARQACIDMKNDLRRCI